MRSARILMAAGSLAIGAALSGCVAAAIPVIAGGAILRTGTDGENARVRVNDVLETSPPRDPALATADLSGESGAFFAGPAPAPETTPPAGLGAREAAGFAPFLAFAESAAAQPPAASRASALLADPTSLSGERKPCRGGPPAILIDLDPAKGLLPGEPAARPRPGLAEGLARLRDAGVEIAWISGQSAAHAGGVREALAASALDPEGSDTLLLMRYPGDRKQTRRDDFAAAACLVAIAGDERRDFDELFDYLVKPEAALGLELLIGDGWFLVPPLFPSDQRPTP